MSLSDFSKCFLEHVGKSSKIAIVIHIDPDYDALGSACALRFYLKDRRKTVHLYSPSYVSETFNYINGVKYIKLLKEESLSKGKYELIIYLDGNNWGRFTGGLGEKITSPNEAQTFRIDHHDQMQVIAAHEYVNKETSSTAEIIYDLFAYIGYEVNKITGSCILIGMLGDTGDFTYGGYTSTSIKKYADIARLLGGKELRKVKEELYFNGHSSYIPYWQVLSNNINIDKESSLLYTYIEYNVQKTLETAESDYKNAKNLFLDGFIRKVRDIENQLIIREISPGVYKGSMRSSYGNFDLRKVCALFENHGGHKQSAGFKTAKPIRDIIRIVKKGLKECYIR